MSAIFLFFVVACISYCQSTPMNNLWDPQIIHTVYGTDKFYKEKARSGLSIHISPFFQHTATAKNGEEIKVPAGNRLGAWNMYGIYFGSGAKPANKQTPVIDGIKTDLQGIDSENKTMNFDFLDDEELFIPDVSATIPLSGNQLQDAGLFDKVRVKYEKIGLRGQISLDWRNNFGLIVKGGIAHIRNDNIIFDRTTPIVPPQTDPNMITPELTAVENTLLTPRTMEDIAEELDLDLGEFCHTGLEDTHAQVYCNIPRKFKDKDGDVVCTVIPHLSVGVWLPTGNKTDPDRPFSVPSGNDGYFAVTTEASLSFDFPKSVQTSFGTGLLFAQERSFVKYRVPSSENQSGIIPWTTGVTNRPGVTWYGNISFKAVDWIEGLGIYCDFIYTQHHKDEFTINECDPTRKKAFEDGDGPRILAEQSCWKNQQANIGFDYRINKNLAFGFGLQCHISGLRVYRTTTALGSISFCF